MVQWPLRITKKGNKKKQNTGGIRARGNANNCHPAQAENAQRSHSDDLFMNLWNTQTHTHTHTHTHKTKHDGLNKAKGVCTDGSIQILPFKRHHVLTYVCNTDDRTTKAADLYGPEMIRVFEYSQKRWLIRARLERVNLTAEEADFKLFQDIYIFSIYHISTLTQNMNNLLSTYRAWKVTENTPLKPPHARCIIS